MKRIILILISISLITNLFAFAGFDDIFSDGPVQESVQPSSFSLSGAAEISAGIFFNNQVFSEQLLRLNLLMDTRLFRTEAALSFDARNNFLQAETLSLTSFFDWGTIEVGLLKKEWGSGDGVHVVDVINAFDYSKGLSDDIFAMKRAELMFISTLYLKQSSLELYLKPTYTSGLLSMADPTKDRWSVLSSDLASMLILPTTLAQTDTLDYIQGGARARTSIGGVDLSLLYYKGHMAQPGMKVIGATSPYPTEPVYTPYQLFGMDTTYVAGQFTFMTEGGYMLSKDTKGTDAALYNSKWVYLAGVSYLEPSSQLYLALLYNGHYISNFDKVEASMNPLDVDMVQAFDRKPYGNTLTLALEMPLFREKLKVRLGATYQIETEGYAFLPSLAWQISDDVQLTLKGVIYGAVGSKSSMFESWKKNDYLTLGITHAF